MVTKILLRPILLFMEGPLGHTHKGCGNVLASVWSQNLWVLEGYLALFSVLESKTFRVIWLMHSTEATQGSIWDIGVVIEEP